MTELAISIKETSLRIGIGRSKTYELIARGELASFHVGRRRLVLADDVNNFVQLALQKEGK